MKTNGLWVMVAVYLTSTLGVFAAAPANQGARTLRAAGQSGSLESFLATTPELKKHVVWTSGDGKRLAFDEWTPAMKGRIDEFYRRMIAQERDLGMHLPTLDKITPHGQAYFTAEVAFDVYAAHVAHVLYLESKRLVPWSIQSLPGVQLDALLASNSYCSRIVRSSGSFDYPTGIQVNRDFQETPEDQGRGEFNGDPRIGYDFLSGRTSATHKSLIGKTELETLVNLTAWLRDNVGHGPMDGSADELAKRYRWLDQRLRPLTAERYAVALVGCHSASKMMVDLARSVNIPLLHTRAYENKPEPGKGKSVHAGLVYGWGGSKPPRVLWHTDELYAMQHGVFFPIDPRSGALLTREQADRLYFDELWVSPQTLAKANFVFRLERVSPLQWWGDAAKARNGDRTDYGYMIGYWNNKGGSNLLSLFELYHQYALCDQPLLELARKRILTAQLTSNINAWRGGFADKELQLLRPLEDYADRAEAALKAIGGPEKFQALCKQAAANRGSNLLAR